jgi:hypothetical protein
MAAPGTVLWDPGTEGYVPLADGDEYVVGRGYWTDFTVETDFMVPGTAVNVDLDYPVAAGWNIISSPYDALMGIDAITNAGCLRYAIAWTDQGSGYELVALLDDALNQVHTDIQPWWAYWVLSDGAGVISWTAPSGSAQSSGDVELLQLGKVDADGGGWQIQLCAEAGGRVDAANYIGLAASENVEALSIPNPPARAGSVDIYFPTDDGPMATSIQSLPTAEASWEFVVTCDIDAPVRLSFPDLSAVPNTYSLRLYDDAAGKAVNLRTVPSYGFTDTAPRRFRIEVTHRGGNALTVSGVSAQQANGEAMAICYSLSADASVDVAIRNISGRLVRSIPCGECSAGVNMASWDLRNASGAMVPSGAYLCTITCRSEDGTQVHAISTARVRR